MNQQESLPQAKADNSAKRNTLPVTLASFAEDILRKYEWINDVSKSVGNKYIDQMSSIVSLVVDSPFHKNLLTFANYYEQIQKNYAITEKEAIRILRKYKWIISFSMSDDFIFEVVRVTRLKGNHYSKINNLFINYFSENNYKELSKLVITWKNNPLFQRRMKIFRDCIFALKINEAEFNSSNIVLPTLISQIDGVLNDYMKKIGVNKKDKDWRKNLKSQIMDNEMPEYSDLAKDLLLEILFQSSNQGKPLKTPFYFNRHKILHGEFTRYGRLDNTLRAFLLLDFLHFISSGNKI
jgi:hypothetical protein